MHLPDQNAIYYQTETMQLCRYGFGCHLDDAGIMWTQGSARRFNMTTEQCRCLYNIMLWSPLRKIKKIVLGASQEAFFESKLDSLIIRAQSLTSITVLQGADDNLLTQLGKFCPHLSVVDVSHSRMVSDDGLHSLFFRKSKSKSLQKTNCSDSIKLVVLMGTGISWFGSDGVVKQLEHTYMKASVPEVLMIREKAENLLASNVPYDQITQSLNGLCLPEQVCNNIAHSLRVLNWGENDMVADQYRAGKDSHTLYFREVNSRHLYACLKVEQNEFVTSLDVQWRGFSMASGLLLDLHDIGFYFPHLTHLKARLDRLWNRPTPLLPRLETLHCWVFSEITLISVLKSCPSVSKLEINISRFSGAEPRLTDAVLAKCLEVNPTLCHTFKEFEVRPCALTVKSLDLLLKKCPNIRRIGDLESWDVSFEEMKQVNQQLERVNSSCLLTVMSFPPKS